MNDQPFYALIIPQSGPGQPPRPWGPIHYPDQGLPGPQPIAGWRPGFPTNPIAPGGQPPRPWGPIYYPDQGLPGNQPIAGWGPGFPTNPIVIPPEDLPSEPVGDDKMVIVVFVPGVGYKMVVVPKPEMPPGYNPPTGPSTERPTPVDR